MPLRPGWPPPPRLLQGTLGHAPPAASPAAATLPLTTLAAPHSLHNSLCLSTPPSLCCSHSLTHYSHPLALFLPAAHTPSNTRPLATHPPRRSHSLQHSAPCYSLSPPLSLSSPFSPLYFPLSRILVTHSLLSLHQSLPFQTYNHCSPISSSTASLPFHPPPPITARRLLPLFSPPSPSPA